jgi:hypothetical protein
LSWKKALHAEKRVIQGKRSPKDIDLSYCKYVIIGLSVQALYQIKNLNKKIPETSTTEKRYAAE